MPLPLTVRGNGDSHPKMTNSHDERVITALKTEKGKL